jgi:hypothetical protein
MGLRPCQWPTRCIRWWPGESPRPVLVILGLLLSVLGVFHAVGVTVGDDDGGVVQQAVEDADRGGLLG